MAVRTTGVIGARPCAVWLIVASASLAPAVAGAPDARDTNQAVDAYVRREMEAYGISMHPYRWYLPWFRTADVEASSRITVRQLLLHTSGLSELDGVKPSSGRSRPDNPPEPNREILGRMARPRPSRRAFLKTSTALAALAPVAASRSRAQPPAAGGPLVAYVGTFSAPLHDMPPTQVDLPPGNGRGIHRFRVNRTTGALTPLSPFALGTSPSCLAVSASGTHLYSANETDSAGDDKQGTVSAFAIHGPDGDLEPLNTVPSGGAGPTYISLHPADATCSSPTTTAARWRCCRSARTGGSATPRTSSRTRAPSGRRAPRTRRRAASPSAATTARTRT